MGYFRDSHPGHEGFCVGFVVREGCDPTSGLYRELLYPGDKADRCDLVALAAGCECGWRSPHFRPSRPASWGPYSVLVCDRDDDRVVDLWSEHLEHTHVAGGSR